jgi:hypothetical protein
MWRGQPRKIGTAKLRSVHTGRARSPACNWFAPLFAFQYRETSGRGFVEGFRRHVDRMSDAAVIHERSPWSHPVVWRDATSTENGAAVRPPIEP